MKQKVINFCNFELEHHYYNYVNSITREVDTTLLGECFIQENNITVDDEDEVFDLIIDWCLEKNYIC